MIQPWIAVRYRACIFLFSVWLQAQVFFTVHTKTIHIVCICNAWGIRVGMR